MIGFAIVVGILMSSLAVFSQTQSELNRAARKDFAAAEDKLRVVYQKLFDSLDTTGQHKLSSAQKAWTAYREAQAALEEDQVRGGTAAPTVLNAARTELTRERIRQLEQLLPNSN
jgi:uncharacterized protein YecT (DUF1311 family)